MARSQSKRIKARVRGEYGGVEDPAGPTPPRAGSVSCVLSPWCCPLGNSPCNRDDACSCLHRALFFFFPPSPLQETYIRCLTRSVWKSCGQGGESALDSAARLSGSSLALPLPSHVTLDKYHDPAGPAGSSSVGGGR